VIPAAGRVHFPTHPLHIDLQPYTTTQAPERSDILNVGGFSDAVFSVVASFLADDGGRFVAEVEAVEL
jgi:60 kDa SS-A/Ro ribonucleoprotein